MMIRPLIRVGLMATLMIAFSNAANAGLIEIFSFGASDPAAGFYAGTIGFGVSDNGVAAATMNLGRSAETAGAYTTGGSTNLLNQPGRVLGISADGSRAVGYAGNVPEGSMVWQTASQTVTGLNSLPGYTQAAAISRNGQYVAGVGGSPPQMASWNFDGTNGTALGNLGGSSFGWAGAVSDNGVVGGTSGNGSRAAVIALAGSSGSTIQLGQGYLDATIANPYGKVKGINSDGTLLVGESDVRAGNAGVRSRAFIVNDLNVSSTLVDLGTVAGFTNFAANSVTDRLFSGSGIVVGNAWNGPDSSPTSQAAMIWVPGSGPDLLANYAATAWNITVPAGYTLLTAYGISSNGFYITGSARDSLGNQVGYLMTTGIASITVVPEPSSIISLAIGTGLCFYSRTRRRRLAA